MSMLDKHFQARFFKAADIVKPLQLSIEGVGEESLRDGSTKPVVFFHGETRGLIVNKTNCMALSEAFGKDENAWTGKAVRLVSEKVDFGGKRVDAIRIQISDPALDDGVNF